MRLILKWIATDPVYIKTTKSKATIVSWLWFVGGDDFKSGQIKVKSVLVDFLVLAGIKVHMCDCEDVRVATILM